jgi:hypothetical protein
VCRALDELPSRLGREPTVAEVAEHLDASPQQVVEAIGAARTRSQLSVDQPLQPDGETTLGELLADAGPREELEDLLVLRELVNQLPERERRVIHLTYVGELTQDEIARGMGCSQMLVSRLLRRAVDRLRRQLLAPDDQSETRVPPSASPPSSASARRPSRAPDSTARHRLGGLRCGGRRARSGRPARRAAPGWSGLRRRRHGVRLSLARLAAGAAARAAAAIAAGLGAWHRLPLAGRRPRGPPARYWHTRNSIDGLATIASAGQPAGQQEPERPRSLAGVVGGCPGVHGTADLLPSCSPAARCRDLLAAAWRTRGRSSPHQLLLVQRLAAGRCRRRAGGPGSCSGSVVP